VPKAKESDHARARPVPEIAAVAVSRWRCDRVLIIGAAPGHIRYPGHDDFIATDRTQCLRSVTKYLGGLALGQREVGASWQVEQPT
jgi:hypothetical protein